MMSCAGPRRRRPCAGSPCRCGWPRSSKAQRPRWLRWMPDQPPAFQFYAKDWLASSAVRRMTLAERGAYIDLLAHAWNDGGIENNPKSIAKLLGTTVFRWQKLAPAVLSRFTKNGDGRMVNKRQESVRAQQVAHHKERSDSGRKGADKRWKRHGSAKNQPLAKNGTASATAVTPSKGVAVGEDVPPSTSGRSPASLEATPEPAAHTDPCPMCMREEVDTESMVEVNGVWVCWECAHRETMKPPDPIEAKRRLAEIKAKVLGRQQVVVDGPAKPVDWSKFDA